jgi:hypothetical protein
MKYINAWLVKVDTWFLSALIGLLITAAQPPRVGRHRTEPGQLSTLQANLARHAAWAR